MKLDLSSYSNALTQLRTALDFARSPLAGTDVKLFEQFRNSAIQCFEFSFELSIKMLRRKLEDYESSATIDQLSYRDLIRTGAERGLLTDPPAWFSYRDMRNICSHTYDQHKAEEVFAQLGAFLLHAQDLLRELNNRNA